MISLLEDLEESLSSAKLTKPGGTVSTLLINRLPVYETVQSAAYTLYINGYLEYWSDIGRLMLHVGALWAILLSSLEHSLLCNSLPKLSELRAPQVSPQ